MASGLSWSGSPLWLPGSRVWRKLSEITGPNLAVISIAGKKGQRPCVDPVKLLLDKASQSGRLEPKEEGIF